MAKRNRNRRKPLPPPMVVDIEGLSHEGRGIARHDGKTIFVFGALPGEKVEIQIVKTNRRYDEANVLDIIQASNQRIEAKCAAFGICGGCSFQHCSSDHQVEIKQQSLAEMMQHAGVDVDNWLPPLRADHWGYRRKARLGVKYVQKKERLLIGFRERSAPYLADMSRCEVLIPEVGHRLDELTALITSLDARETIPQIEVAADDNNVILVFRHLKELSLSDLEKLEKYAKTSGFWIQLQSAGPDSIINLYPEIQKLYFFPLTNNDLKIEFGAADFVQVNNDINQQMVAQAIDLLELDNQSKVLDLFCGLGNFTLPLSQIAASITAVEGDVKMVERARESALDLSILNTEYFVGDLTKPDIDQSWMKEKYDRMLFDPPRSGANEICKIVKRFDADKILYVSCQPSSLVRDAVELNEQGYRLSHLGVMDMFPQTAHVESMALFERGKKPKK